MSHRLTFASNNGPIGGGEVMLLQLATAARNLGHDVHVVGPDHDGGVLDRASDAGFPVSRLSADRRRYIAQLRTWDWQRRGVLWCNGLVPAFATAGHRRRIVHLHRLPEGTQRLAATAARARALRTVVPATFMTQEIRGATVLPNWSPPVEGPPPVDTPLQGKIRVGFLGRLGLDKGIHLLATAVARLQHEGVPSTLSVAGEPRFVDPRSQGIVHAALAEVADLETLGWVPPEDFFQRIDVLVVPSVWPEPFGLVVTEAMSARVPVIVTDAGALPEVVGPEHPWVARHGDADALIEVIQDFALSAPERRQWVVADAHRRWLTEYSPEAGQRRVAEFLSELLDKATDQM